MTSDDLIVKTIKDSGVVKTIKKTGEVNPFKKFEISDVKKLVKNMSEYLEAQGKSGISLDKFINKTKALKAGSIFANIGISILFVGVVIPKLTFLMRQMMHGTTNNPAIANVEKEVKNNNKVA